MILARRAMAFLPTERAVSNPGGTLRTRTRGAILLFVARCYELPAPIPQRPDERWDFVRDTTADCRPIPVWTLVDDLTRECPLLMVDRSLPARRVAEALDGLLLLGGRPRTIVAKSGRSSWASRSISGPARTARARPSSGVVGHSRAVSSRASRASRATSA